MKPVEIELTDFKTKKVVDTLEVDACMVATGRAPYTNGELLNAARSSSCLDMGSANLLYRKQQSSRNYTSSSAAHRSCRPNSAPQLLRTGAWHTTYVIYQATEMLAGQIG